MVSADGGCDPGEVAGGEITVSIRLCRKCAAASGTEMEVGLVAGGLPNYAPRTSR